MYVPKGASRDTHATCWRIEAVRGLLRAARAKRSTDKDASDRNCFHVVAARTSGMRVAQSATVANQLDPRLSQSARHHLDRGE